jgi:integrase
MLVESKRGARRRVPFGGKVSRILSARLKASPSSRFVLGDSPSTMLNRISRRLHKAHTNFGKGAMKLYRLRLSFAYRWLGAGGSPDLLAAVMGWSSFRLFKTLLSPDAEYAIAARFQSQLEEQE